MAEHVDRRFAVPLVAIAAGAVLSVLLGVYGAHHQPTFRPITTFGFGSLIAMKVYLASAVGVLGLVQLVGALWMYGGLRLPVPRRLGAVHRATGFVAVLLSLPVAFHCLWALGFQASGSVSLRVAVHSVLGCALYGILVVKVVAVHARRAPGWLLPVAGGLLFTTLVVVVWTSAVWFVGAQGWP